MGDDTGPSGPCPLNQDSWSQSGGSLFFSAKSASSVRRIVSPVAGDACRRIARVGDSGSA